MSNLGIQDFYVGRSIFITGATGFMGKVLVEKLLRSCPGINRVYLLIRPKTDKDVRFRLQEMIKCKLFEWLRQNQPDALTKIIPISGDVTLPDLGISFSDMQELIANVSVVFHSAARVKFDDDLRSAINSNVKGPKRVAIFCRQLKDLKAFVHVSTTYNNVEKDTIEEEVYPTSLDPQKLLDLIDCMDDKLLASITNQLVGTSPNVYAYTKALGEHLLQDLTFESGKQRLPLAIVRPSMVTAAVQEPLPGWIDNFNGPSGTMAGTSKGLIQIVRVDPELIADIIPVDFPINLMLAAAWDEATCTKSSDRIRVYNCSSGSLNPIIWRDFRNWGLRGVHEFPCKEIMRYPNIKLQTNRLLFNIEIILYHHVPALFFDTIALLFGRKPFVARLFKRAHKMMSCLEFYTMREWNFPSQNPVLLMDKMSVQEKNTFNFDVRKIDWETYMTTFAVGVREYLFKDDLSSLPAARKNLNKMKLLRMVVHFVILGLMLLFLYALWTKFTTETSSIVSFLFQNTNNSSTVQDILENEQFFGVKSAHILPLKSELEL
ncbi:LOW QUALITY PROTEIN: putative fatty acyl-CoA reductase CG5065 [Daphnia pulicaria]|uniref:LOW QUALITY PROTEIN: putative fatty acyl-CoA reductase CG5065 n=1 Tax=Daphnia pulicaria TaxID=35523 RepID=UPI001EEC71F1|nr:LOW QUALITY PROTEIN: putative fatty acyl-CoA reductase CG5065 [Daphnia pulicaria]